MPAIIRPAANGDLAELLEIEESWTTTPQWKRTHFEREIGSDRHYFVVADDGGAVAGFAGLLKIAPEAQVTTIAVAPGRARRGIGRTLMEHLIGAAREWDYEKVTLEVGHTNAPALKLYESLGFRVVGRRAKYYNDGSDALLMDLELR